ncbi:MAG TPA: ATP-grasp domain-containing protein [Thermoflexales bacterium]|nr:ATP-grasp domain-containing protein [Thermoflexales bacterium]
MANILWLDKPDPYTKTRVMQAAAQLNLHVAFHPITDISFFVDEPVMRLDDERDILQEFDVLVARPIYPGISEFLTVARLFHRAGKRVIDTSLTDEGYAVSKMHDYVLLAQAGVPVPRTWQIANLAQVEEIAAGLGYPCILKGAHGSYGLHVHRVNHADGLREVFGKYPPGELMLQEFLPDEGDFRVICLGYTALPVLIHRQPPPGDFRVNAEVGGTAIARRAEDYPEICAIAQQAARALRREFAGVDIHLQNGQPRVLEVNRRPGFEQFETVTGYDVAGAALRYANQGLTGLRDL